MTPAQELDEALEWFTYSHEASMIPGDAWARSCDKYGKALLTAYRAQAERLRIAEARLEMFEARHPGQACPHIHAYRAAKARIEELEQSRAVVVGYGMVKMRERAEQAESALAAIWEAIGGRQRYKDTALLFDCVRENYDDAERLAKEAYEMMAQRDTARREAAAANERLKEALAIIKEAYEFCPVNVDENECYHCRVSPEDEWDDISDMPTANHKEDCAYRRGKELIARLASKDSGEDK